MSPRANLDKETVIQMAARLADEEGLEALSMARLARELGIRTPSLYNYVDGLPDLRRQLAVLGTRALGARLGRAAIGKGGDEAVMAMSQAYRAYILEHPGLYAATVGSAHPPETHDPELEAAQVEVVEIVLAVLSAYQLEGQDAIHAARGLRSLVHGFATLELAGGFGMPVEVEESFRRLVSAFTQSLREGGMALANLSNS